MMWIIVFLLAVIAFGLAATLRGIGWLLGIAAGLVVLFLLIAGSAQAGTARFICSFDRSSDVTGTLKTTRPFVLEFVVDTVTGDAFLAGNNGIAPVHVYTGAGAVSFVEPVATGVVQTTTFDRSTGEAVHSRHTIMMGEPMFHQYYGSCRRGS